MIVLSYILMFLSAIFVCASFYVKFVIGENNFYENIYMIIHSVSASGTFSTFWSSVKDCLLWFFLILIVFFLLNKFVFIKRRKHVLASSIFLVVSLIGLLSVMHFDEYVVNSLSSTKIYEEYYVNTNDVKITFPKKKRNVILIYLESMEASLFSKENGGVFKESIIPELEEIAKENLNFSNSEKLGGAMTLDNTSCTIFSLVTSTSATPVYPRLFHPYGENNPYMRNVRSLGNVLKENGYNLGAIQGSSIKFSAADYYLKENGDFEVFDDDTARERGLIDKNYSVWWGMEDKKVLEFSKAEITKLSKMNEPFAYIVTTTDTHFPNGYLDETCDTPYKEHFLNSYACSSKMVSNYLEWLKKQDFYNNTTIVIMGDHKVKQDSLYRDYKDYERSNYNAIINSVVEGHNKNRLFSQFDMYPTILASMGVQIDGNRIGFGVNLFSGEKTMIELLGREKFDREIFKNSDYYNKYILSNQSNEVK